MKSTIEIIDVFEESRFIYEGRLRDDIIIRAFITPVGTHVSTGRPTWRVPYKYCR